MSAMNEKHAKVSEFTMAYLKAQEEIDMKCEAIKDEACAKLDKITGGFVEKLAENVKKMSLEELHYFLGHDEPDDEVKFFVLNVFLRNNPNVAKKVVIGLANDAAMTMKEFVDSLCEEKSKANKEEKSSGDTGSKYSFK